MATSIRRPGSDEVVYVVRGERPVRGDFIVMELPETEPIPPGYTLLGQIDGNRYCAKTADGTETSFAHPAAWYRPTAARV
jgi:hypothetical protein